MEQSRGTVEGQFLNARRRYRAGQYQEALLEFRTLTERKVDMPNLDAWIAACHLAMGKEEEARALYDTKVMPVLVKTGTPLPMLLARDLSALPPG